jgi:hypothetical protein
MPIFSILEKYFSVMEKKSFGQLEKYCSIIEKYFPEWKNIVQL